ncbi:hypothetical protein Ciccas_011913, partial [Cichlidogyrus casuarinus]
VYQAATNMGLRASNCKLIQYSQGTRTTFGVAYVDVDNVDNGGNPLLSGIADDD